jgi:hypothetical protein
MSTNNRTEVFGCTQWTTWCGGAMSDKCGKCGLTYVNPSFEMNVRDNGIERYISIVCIQCAQKFYEADIDTEICFKENKQVIHQLMEIGLVTDEYIKKHYKPKSKEKLETRVEECIESKSEELTVIENRENNFNIMISSGAKEGLTNMDRMGGCMGLQVIEGKRIPKKLKQLTIPYFFQNNNKVTADDLKTLESKSTQIDITNKKRTCSEISDDIDGPNKKQK